ncbi:MAG: lysophospholipid acyltransferase family protein [Myxococcales bacterium]
MPLPPMTEPASRAERVRTAVVGGATTGFLVGTLLGFNAAQSASLVLRPLTKKGFRSFNRWAAQTWWSLLVESTRVLYGTHLVVSGDDVPRDENAIVVCNHQEMADIPYLLAWARLKGRLGDVKWFAKKSLQYVPGVGWGMWFLDCPFLDRDWSKDRRSIERTFGALVGEKLPVWLVSFPEGTRQTADNRAASRRYAEEHGIPPFEHLLLPRTKGFCATVQGLRSHVGAVYDLTLAFEEGVPTLWQFMKGYARQAHLHVRRFPVRDLPEGDEALSEWLMLRFREKDELLGRYYRTGRFEHAAADRRTAG